MNWPSFFIGVEAGSLWGALLFAAIAWIGLRWTDRISGLAKNVPDMGSIRPRRWFEDEARDE